MQWQVKVSVSDISNGFPDGLIIVCPKCERCWSFGKFGVFIQYENEALPKLLAEEIVCTCGFKILPPKLFYSYEDAEKERDRCVWRFTNSGTTLITQGNCPYKRVPSPIVA